MELEVSEVLQSFSSVASELLVGLATERAARMRLEAEIAALQQMMNLPDREESK